MGRIIHWFQQPSLHKSFVLAVLSAALVAAMLSIAAIYACTAVQHWLVPVRDEVMLNVHTQTSYGETYSSTRMRANGDKQLAIDFITESDGKPNAADPVTHYSIDPIASPSYLSPKKWMLYKAMDICKVALPLLFAVAGISISAAVFYRRKLAHPIALLEDSSQKITMNNLDFTIQYGTQNEMGRLCDAFEAMRAALLDSQRAIWAVMEERKQLNASVAHDLRTPITIIEGYTEYLQRHMKSGKIDEEKLSQILGNLSESAVRLECYVDSVRDIQSLDDLSLVKTKLNITTVVREAIESFTLLAEKAGKGLSVACSLQGDEEVWLDRQVLFRILENIVSNAIRYANLDIVIEIIKTSSKLICSVSDDGPGFSTEAMLSACTPFFKDPLSEGHMGLGLSICSILCKKHGGALTVGNSETGGTVSFEISVNKTEP